MFPVRDTIPSRYAPVITFALIAVNALVFLVEISLPEEALERLFYRFGLVPARYRHPEWAEWVGFPIDNYWPFLTSMFLHGGWLHVILNMWSLWLFGDNVEDLMGGVRFLAFYLLTGLVAGITHYLTNGDSTIPTVGASGAVAGVMGAYLVLFPLSRVIVLVPVFIFPFFFELPAVLYLGMWFVGQLFSGTLSLAGPADVGGIAFWAHIGGFVAGVALHPLFLSRQRLQGARPRRDRFHLG